MIDKKLLVILGPTATGKTDLGIVVAKKLNGELVAADSRQVYRGLDIGTGKLPGREVVFSRGEGFWEIDGVKVWLYDLINPTTQFHVAQYVLEAKNKIKNIFARNKLPIIVGGTGMYIKALIYGFSDLFVPTDEKLRRELEELNLQQLQEKLQLLSPAAWKKLTSSDRGNKRRLIRKIEIVYMNPYISNFPLPALSQEFPNDILFIGLTTPRSILNQRIDLRVDKRIEAGMLNEAESLFKEGLSIERMRQLGLEYGVFADYLEAKMDKNQVAQKLKIKIHQYAKRQMTYFNKMPNINWFDVSKKGWQSSVEKLISSWYNEAR